jgi:hypothetical protein
MNFEPTRLGLRIFHLSKKKKKKRQLNLHEKREWACSPAWPQGSNNKPNKNLWFSSVVLSLSVYYTLGGWGKRSKSFFLIMTRISHGRRDILTTFLFFYTTQI